MIKDHMNNQFSSVSAMCKQYNITRSAYNHRIARGWSVEEALTTKLQAKDMSKNKSNDDVAEDKKARQREYNKNYYMTHLDKERERRAKYRAANREKENAKHREYYAKNKDKIKEYRDRPENKAYQKEYQKKYNQKKKEKAEKLAEQISSNISKEDLMKTVETIMKVYEQIH